MQLQVEFKPDPFLSPKLSSDIGRLLSVFEADYKDINNLNFSDISEFVLKVIKNRVFANRENKKQLNYDLQKYPSGRTIIAVGGISLLEALP